MHALFLTTVLPGNQRGGGEVVSQLFIEAIRAAGWSLTVLGYQRRGDPSALGPDVVAIGERTIETAAGRTAAMGWFAQALVRRLPYTSAKFRSRVYRTAVVEALMRESPDLVVIDHSQLAWILDEIRMEAPVAVVAHNVEADLYEAVAGEAQRLPARAVYSREARLVLSAERRLVRRAAQVWTLTESDARCLGGAVFAIPSRSLRRVTSSPPPTAAIRLLGSWTWKPNREGLEWFVAEVLERLPPGPPVQIAGRGAQWLTAHPRIELVGVVPNAAEFLAGARVIAVPSVRGGGVQVKTLDAIASGVPVVASPAALRGIGAVPASVQRADTAEHFARELTRLAVANPDPKVSDEAIAWSRVRYERFFADVAAALAAVPATRSADAARFA